MDRHQKYRLTDKYKETLKKRRSTPEHKLKVNAYRAKPKFKAHLKKWWKDYYKKNREKLLIQAKERNTKLHREREAQYPKPDVCDCCHKKAKRLVWDHCHWTNKFRGWLCDRCNQTCGLIDDDVSLARALDMYLRAHGMNVEYLWSKGKLEEARLPEDRKKRWACAPRPKPDACECCARVPNKTRLSKIVLDHCHVTGIFRGWICNRCNLVLGAMKDDRVVASDIATYLQGHWVNVQYLWGRDRTQFSIEDANTLFGLDERGVAV